MYAANERICNRLSISDALHITGDKFSFVRIAGFFPITDQLELEVTPKFLAGSDAWRADFLLLLTHTRWGIISERDTISSSKSRKQGISDALALVFLSLFESVSHVPIRTYRRRTVQQFDIVGDLDEESILLPDIDGFTQKTTELTKRNTYNAVIVRAAKALLHSLTDFDLRSRLSRAIVELGPQGRLPETLPRFVPNRYRSWQGLFDLCVEVLDGYGIDYINQGEILSPGFVVRTSDAWEEFLRQALTLGLNGVSVAYQEQHPFARRDNSTIRVRPDYILRGKNNEALLVDAKYKYSDAKCGTISNADIYEGWAFMEATGIPRLALLYPYSSSSSYVTAEPFQHIRRGSREIVGIRVNPRFAGIGSSMRFASELGACLQPMMATIG